MTKSFFIHWSRVSEDGKELHDFLRLNGHELVEVKRKHSSYDNAEEAHYVNAAGETAIVTLLTSDFLAPEWILVIDDEETYLLAKLRFAGYSCAK